MVRGPHNWLTAIPSNLGATKQDNDDVSTQKRVPKINRWLWQGKMGELFYGGRLWAWYLLVMNTDTVIVITVCVTCSKKAKYTHASHEFCNVCLNVLRSISFARSRRFDIFTYFHLEGPGWTQWNSATFLGPLGMAQAEPVRLEGPSDVVLVDDQLMS